MVFAKKAYTVVFTEKSLLFYRYRAIQRHIHYLHQHLAKQVVTLTQNHQESLLTSLTVLENCILVKQSHESNLLHISTANEKAFLPTICAILIKV